MARIKNRRKRYLVDKKMQLQFAWLLVMQIAIPTIVLGAFLYIVNKMYLTCIQTLIGDSVISDPYIQSILNFSVLAIGVFLIVSTLLVIFLGIRFSHHIAGPLYKLEESMDKIARGEKIAPLCFRNTDLMHSLADKFNTIMERLNQIKQ